jgi:8-oxo-dGTP diphosphatase
LRIASCHSSESLARAAQLGFDAAVVGPVMETATHPGQAALGWDGFAALVLGSNLPIYAIGGLSPRDLSSIWECRGRGVAAISAYWGRGGGSGSSSPSASTAGIE